MKLTELQSLTDKATDLHAELAKAERLVDAIEQSNAGSYETFVRIPKGGAYGQVGLIATGGVSKETALMLAQKQVDAVLNSFKSLNIDVDCKTWQPKIPELS